MAPIPQPSSKSVADSLEDFPGVHLAVDVVVLTVTQIPGEKPRLQMLAHRRPEGYLEGTWMVPGRFIRPGERVAQCAEKCLELKPGLTGVKTRQLIILDDPARDERGWTMSIGCLATVDYAKARAAVAASPEDRMLVDIGERHIYLPAGQGELPFSQVEIVNAAINYLRDRYFTKPDPRRFLGSTFTLRELYEVHCAVWGEEVVSPDTFRRTMEPLLDATGDLQGGRVGKPSMLFRRRASGRPSSSVRRLERPSASNLR